MNIGVFPLQYLCFRYGGGDTSFYKAIGCASGIGHLFKLKISEKLRKLSDIYDKDNKVPIISSAFNLFGCSRCVFINQFFSFDT